VSDESFQLRHRLALGAVALLFLFGAGVRWWIGRPEREAAPRYEADVEPLLAAHCLECHDEATGKGDLVLDAFASPEERIASVALWGRVHDTLESQTMPPPDRTPLAEDERQRLLAWIEREVFRLDPARPDPGAVTMRRLNREEYRNSVRDLVGNLPWDPAADLPPDDTGYGFDTIGEVLTMAPDLFEKYVLASERIVDALIRTRPTQPNRVSFRPEEHFQGLQHMPHGSGTLSSQGTVGVKLEAERDGDYRVRVLAGADHAGNELPEMKLKIPGRFEKIVRVEAETARPKAYEEPVRLPRGTHWLEVSFLNDHYEPNHPDPRRRDRNLHLFSVEFTGPVDVAPPPPSPFHQRLLALAGEGPDRQRAERVLAAFGRRAWRRPVSAAEVDRLAGLADAARADGESFDESLKLALQAVLVSPAFLFRGEGTAEGKPDEGRIVPVGEFELASRLSYFLWSSLPDERLLGLAEQGDLRANLAAEVDRMLADAKARALTANFAGQWLQLRNLDLVQPDRKTYPQWDDALRRAVREETELVFASIFAENRSLLEFLDSDYTYLNDRLARHYGIPGVDGPQFRRVALRDEARRRRGGILTHASVLTLTSHPNRTSPMNRGNWVLETILGTPPPPPPENVPLLEDSKRKAANGSLRAQLEVHRADALCASCHERMDPIGFALEHYDGIGAWRDRDGGERIDAAGSLRGLGEFGDFAALRDLLVKERSEAFVRSLAASLLTYALGRGLEPYDKPAVAEIQARVTRSGMRARELVLAVVESVPFQMRRGAGFGSPPPTSGSP
jgi:mono/diheme cytochrome c family protein